MGFLGVGFRFQGFWVLQFMSWALGVQGFCVQVSWVWGYWGHSGFPVLGFRGSGLLDLGFRVSRFLGLGFMGLGFRDEPHRAPKLSTQTPQAKQTSRPPLMDKRKSSSLRPNSSGPGLQTRVAENYSPSMSRRWLRNFRDQSRGTQILNFACF